MMILTAISMAMSASVCSQQPLSLEGKWRGEFTIRDSVKVPFQFRITPEGKVYLLNAEEELEAGVVKRSADSLWIPLDQFDNELAFKIEDSTLTGEWRKQDHTGKRLPVSAEKGKDFRFFPVSDTSTGDYSGTYDIRFDTKDGKQEKAVALFKQKGNTITATFLRASGDSRYLQGNVKGNRFYVSGFFGSSPAYYTGNFEKNGKITGMQTGINSTTAFSGTYDHSARLSDAFAVTGLKEGISRLDFLLPDMQGNMISLKDEKFRNKVVIVMLTGTWCPNCMDEARFMSEWFAANKSRGVEAVAIHYERQADTAFMKKVMRRYQQRFNITYDQVAGGTADKKSVESSLPALQNFQSFPTTIFIGCDGKVSAIHSGFSGPATGKHYEMLVKEFNEEVERLIKKTGIN